MVKVLIFMIFVGILVISNNAKAESLNKKETLVENQYYIIFYTITDEWEDGFNATISIQNIGDETIYNWKMELETENAISNIWNAQVLEKEIGKKYNIKNNTFNRDIEHGETVFFGLTVNKDIENKNYFSNARLLYAHEEIEEDGYKVNVDIKTSWENHELYEITIENISEKDIINWNLSFNTNGIIDDIWNAQIKESLGNEVVVSCKDYNSIIGVNDKVSFGIEMKYGDINIKEIPSNFIITLSENDFLNNLYFIGNESDDEMNQYAKNIIDIHLQVFAEDGNLDLREYKISEGIQAMELRDDKLSGLDFYYYWIYTDNQIIGYLKVYYENNELQSCMTLCDLIRSDFLDENAVYSFVYVDNSLCLMRDNKIIEVLESTIMDSTEEIKEGNSIIINGDNTINLLNDSTQQTFVKNSSIKTKAAANTGKTLAVPIVLQGSNPICWAASMASVHNYRKGTKYTAKDIIKKTKHGNKGATLTQIYDYFKNTFKLSCTKGSPLSYAGVKSRIQANQPIYAMFHTKDGKKAHIVVIKGYYQQNNKVVYYLMNPQSSSSQTITVASGAQKDGSEVNGYMHYKMYWYKSIYDFR